MNNLIILIHGTFGKKAPWTKSDSSFCTSLKEKLDGKVEFETFVWSGENTHSERIWHSTRLVDRLNWLLEEYPNYKKTIISHSHGGNIALYALKKIGHLSANFNLVTMATPFLNSSFRSFEKNTKTYVFSFTFTILNILYWVLGLVLNLSLSIFKSKNITYFSEHYFFKVYLIF